MTKEEENSKNSHGFINFVILLFLLLAILTSGFAFYEIYLLSSIENMIRYCVMGFIGLVDLFLIVKTMSYFKKSRKKKRKRGLFIFFLFLYSLICMAIGGGIFYFYDKINNMNKDKITYTSVLLVMADSKVEKLSDLKNMTIGILGDKKSPDGYIIPQEIIKENKLHDDNEMKEYDDYTTMLVDLYNKELDAMFVSDSYTSMFSGITGYENVQTDTRVLTKKEKEMKKAETSEIETLSAGKSVTEPFTILLMGIDSTEEVLTKNAIANGDTLILITFNPKTLNATMLSIPRDSYVPIACWNGRPENKITHAAAYGNDCMINTIQNYFDTKIDYYVKINFKGLVKLVDAVGGVDVYVEKELCTDNSSRVETVCIYEGYQTLDGEHALVFARNRKQLDDGDFGRARHQQEIVMALINKIKDNVSEVSTFVDILNTVSNSMDTNLTTKQILSFYDVGKDIIKRSLSSDKAELINIQQLYLQGIGQMIYDERARMVLWDYIPNENSRKDIIQAMKENLELVDHKNITEFHFSINKPYQKPIIGEGPYSKTSSYTLLPDFTGENEESARKIANLYGVKISFQGSGGTVVEQSYPVRKRVDLIKDTVLLTLSGGSQKQVIEEDEDDDDEVEDKDKDKDKDKEEGQNESNTNPSQDNDNNNNSNDNNQPDE